MAVGVSWLRWPAPAIHDEFSYLLAADTLAHGRTANPTHPHWQHFETFHVVQQPAYASKYPPGQGLLMAAGQRLCGHPLAGIWLLTALATVSFYWMLLGWTTPRWAAVGGMLCLIHPGLQLVWGQSYWGGGLAFAGGSLVFGGAVRLCRRQQVIDAVAMSSGAAMLAVSRPFEGFVFCLLVGGWVIASWIRRDVTPWRRVVWASIVPQLVIFAGLGAGLAAYNQSITGDPWQMPYVLHEATYGRCPLFLWQPPAPEREYRHEVVAGYHNQWSLDWYRKQQSWSGLLGNKLKWASRTWQRYFPQLVGLPLLMLLPMRRLGRVRIVLAIAGVVWLVSQTAVWNYPHYIAPIGPLLLLAVVWGLRRLDVLSRRRLGGWRLSTAVVALQALLFAHVTQAYVEMPKDTWNWQRQRIVEQLQHTPGQHLVIVRYAQEHPVFFEWVYNDADIDRSKIVWAREMGAPLDRELCRYFADRHLWLLEADAASPQVVPYDPPAPTGPPTAG
jgi:hypothetical protein